MKNLKNFAIVLTVIALGLTSCEQGNKVPEKVKTAFVQKFPDAQKIKWDMEEENEWEAEFEMNGKEYSANFDTNGNWKETESEIEVKDLPVAVMNMLNTDFDGYQMEDEAAQVEQPGKNGYEVVVKKGAETIELFVDETGKIIKKENVKPEKENEETEEQGNRIRN